ncbi:hypothetical protein C0431_12295 [bacterium]|nr:hypothetical protein [bacterium]
MDNTIEWSGPEATITRMNPLAGVPLEEGGAFDGRRVTGYQFLVTTSGQGHAYINLSNVVAPEDRGRVGFVKHSAARGKWETVPFTIEGARYRIPSSGGLYALTLNTLSESRYVDDAVSTFPGWFAGVLDRNSNLRQLANIPASIFEDIAEGLSEVLKRTRLDSIPLEIVHETYRYEMDGLDLIEGLEVKEEKSGVIITLNVTEDLAQLYYDPVGDVVLLDRKRSVMHRLKSDGPIHLQGMIREERVDKVLDGKWTPVFNEFDEIGLQFGLPRLNGEDNGRYRERMETLFTHPGNATKYGIMREVARRTGNFKKVRWVNPYHPLVVHNPMGLNIAREDVSVDGKIMKVSMLPDGGFMIHPTNDPRGHEVVFHWGAEAYTLHPSRFTETGVPSQVDIESYEKWDIAAPVLYGGIRYDRQEWDMVNDESLIETMPELDNKMERWS